MCSMQEQMRSSVLAVIFWAGFILGHGLNWQCNRIVKKYEQKRNLINKKHIPAIFLFGSNRYARVTDLLMLFFLSILAALIFLKVKNEIVVFTALSQSYLFLNLHVIYNGRFMRYTNKKVEGEQGNEQTQNEN